MHLIVLQRTECQSCCWWLDSVFPQTQMQHFTHASRTFGTTTITLNLRTMKTKEVGIILTQLNLPILSSEVQI